jgi:hypothetical protein
VRILCVLVGVAVTAVSCCRFKFGTVTTGEFRDHFTGFIEARAIIDSSRQSGTDKDKDNAIEATPNKKGGKNAKKNAPKGNNNNGKGGKDATPPKGQPTAAMVAAEAVKKLDWQHLLFAPGMPTDVTSFSNSLAKAAEDLAHKWIKHAATYKTDSPPSGTSPDDMKVQFHDVA